MAKKKVTTTVEEEVVPEETPEIDYKEVHDNDLKDIASNDTKVEEPIVEDKKEDKPEETPDTPAIDPEQIKADAVKEATDATTKKILDALSPETTSDEKTDILADAPWKAENRTPSYDEALEFLANKVEANFEAKQQAKVEEALQNEEDQKAAEQANLDNFNTYTDELLGDLYNSGKLPKIVNAEDENDAGVKARVALFQTMADVNTKRVQENKQPIYSIKEIFYEHYQSPTAQPAGADAPINGKTSSATSTDDQQIDYRRDVAGPRTLLDIVRGRK